VITGHSKPAAKYSALLRWFASNKIEVGRAAIVEMPQNHTLFSLNFFQFGGLIFLVGAEN
jgi:hypothetical protein